MKFYNLEQAAEKLSMRQEGALALCQSGWFGQKVANTWLITGQEIKAYFAGKVIERGKLPKLYDADHVIKDLRISRSRFYRLVAQNKIKGLRFGNRGGNPNLVFTAEQLVAAKEAVAGIDGSGQRYVDADQHIEERDGRFYVLGTLTEDPDGVERNYKSRTIARAKAREAYGQAPVYKAGDSLRYGDQKITVLKDVTPIDGLAHLKIGGVEVLWPVRRLIAYEDDLNQQDKELVTVYKDGNWPEGDENGTDKQDSSK